MNVNTHLALFLPFFFINLIAGYSQQTVKKFNTSTYGDIYYLEHLPDDYNNSNKTYPVILFLHGGGEKGNANGSQINKVKKLGLPKVIEEGKDLTTTVNGKTHSFIVISPQLNYDVNNWTNGYIDAIMQSMLEKYRIDPSRIYLTGLSLGGGGTWSYTEQNANVLAAIAPLAGSRSPNTKITRSIVDNKLPVWIFHGENDNIYPSERATQWADMLNNAGANPAPKVNIYPGLGHDTRVWDNAYRTDNSLHNPNLYQWFLQHQRGSTPPPPVNQSPVALAGADRTIKLPEDQIQLDGSASYDPDGKIVSYEWSKLDGPDGSTFLEKNTKRPTVKGLREGQYTFRLQVTDDKGKSSADEVLVTVRTATDTCDCDHIVPANRHVTDGKALGIQPGDIICLKAETTYGNLKFINLQGTASNPIIIRNCGGQVTINTTASFALKAERSRYFQITGSGDSKHTYGIVLKGAESLGLTLDVLSSDFEVDHLEISNIGFAGIMAKTDPKCGEPRGRDDFTMTNIHIHNNYIYEVRGEGIYVGNSFYAKGAPTKNCGRLFPHAIHNAKVHHNRIERTGWDGIQVGSVTKGAEIYENVIIDAGRRKEAVHGNGIQIGEGTGGICYNNTIQNSFSNGLIVLGYGDNIIYNNTITNAGGNGVFIDSRPPATPGDGFKFINNTIVNANEDGIKIYADNAGLKNKVINNIIVNPKGSFIQKKYSGQSNVEIANNYQADNVTSLFFQNLGENNYQLKSNSPAKDYGKDVSQFGIVQDFNGVSRPQGTAYDAGAFEFVGNTPNSPDTFTFEAECLSFNATQWQKVTDEAASGGSYLKVRKNFNSNSENIIPSHTLKAEVTLPEAGTYHLFGRYKAKDFTNDSFWVRIDGGAWINWTLSNRNNVFAWKKVNNLEVANGGFQLTEGIHTITVAYRESESMLDKLILSTDNTVPEGKSIQSPSGCQNTNNLIAYSEINTENSSTSFQLYPNPSNNVLYVQIPDTNEKFRLTIVTLAGKHLYNVVVDKNRSKELAINLENLRLKAGMYFLKIGSEKHSLLKRFVKR